MNRKDLGVVFHAAAAFAVGFAAACAPTNSADEVSSVSEALSVCGNGVCDTGETCASCPGDCGRCTQEHCGNDVCGRKETCVTCTRDCGACSGCGNGVCDAAETCANCAADCGRCNSEFCGNGVCSRRESCTACSRDCCPSPQCTLASDCPATNNQCTGPSCVAGQCSTSFVASGTPVQNQTPGDCQKIQCNGAGGTTQVADNNDVPLDDGNECTASSCVNGVPSSPLLQAGTPCSAGVCDGMGTCVQCLGATDCPAPMNECTVAACVTHSCTSTFAATGTPTSTQTSGDCHVTQCDGMGGTTSVVDDMDVPNDNNPCTDDVCLNGVGSHVDVTQGVPCNTGGMLGHCSAGSCL